MLVLTNEVLARKQVRRANLFVFTAMAAFGTGFLVNLARPEDSLSATVSLVALGLGIFLWQVSQYYQRRYGPRQRLDGALATALKGLDNRYSLVSFADVRLPDYLLIGPHGVRVVVARGVDGTIRCRRDQWSRAQSPALVSMLIGNPVRNPTVEAVQGVSQVNRFLDQELQPDEVGQVPVSGVIVFTNPKVRLEIEGARFPVSLARDLRLQLDREKGPLGPPRIAQLRRLFSPPAAPRSAAG